MGDLSRPQLVRTGSGGLVQHLQDPPEALQPSEVVAVLEASRVDDKDDKTDVDEEVFEIFDYTQASPWEKLISKVEEAVRGWESAWALRCSPGGDSENRMQPIMQTSLEHNKRFYRLSYHPPPPAIPVNVRSATPPSGSGTRTSSAEFDRPCLTKLHAELSSDRHKLHHWFGVDAFLLLCPAVAEYYNGDLSEAMLLLSSLAIASHNTKSIMPVFVSVHQRWRESFLGCHHATLCRMGFSFLASRCNKTRRVATRTFGRASPPVLCAGTNGLRVAHRSEHGFAAFMSTRFAVAACLRQSLPHISLEL
jgi:Rab3 GTPase-activating protein catalytic subunit